MGCKDFLDEIEEQSDELAHEFIMGATMNHVGYNDVYIMRLDTAKDVLTDKRMEIIDEISNGDITGIRELARLLDRDPGAVKRDLNTLFKCGVVDFEDNGNKKKPVIKHDTIIIKPIILGERQ